LLSDNILSKELKEFKSLFDLTPSISILNYTQKSSYITKFLEKLIEPYEGDITVIEGFIPIKKVRMLARVSSCDYAIICNSILEHKEKINFMKTIDKILRDSGYLIILEKKDKKLDDIYNLLEEFDYGAISSIDIFDNYNLIMAKKLHMWGMD
jgi:hypothetical protein